jgi:hypothetical protein
MFEAHWEIKHWKLRINKKDNQVRIKGLHNWNYSRCKICIKNSLTISKLSKWSWISVKYSRKCGNIVLEACKQKDYQI